MEPTSKQQTQRSPKIDKNEEEPCQKKILESPDPERVKVMLLLAQFVSVFQNGKQIETIMPLCYYAAST